MEENMEMTEMMRDEVLFGCNFNPYLKKLLESSDLELLQEGKIRNAYEREGVHWLLLLSYGI